MKKPLLMIPGPCALTEEVQAAMSQPLVPHYGEEWVREYNETRNNLKPLLGTKEKVYLTVGSGHAGVEAAVNALAGCGEKMLVVDNGFFGERIACIAQSYGIKVVLIKEEWGKPVDPALVEKVLEDERDVRALAVVHGETSTGVVNPIKEIGEITCRWGIPLFVDAVCSVGGMEFLMDEWGVDVCVTASQKGLAAPPGLAIIALSERAQGFLAARKSPRVGWYLNLQVWQEFEEKQGHFQPYGITMAVNNVRALKVSLDQIHQEGLKQRFHRHEQVARRIREGVTALGLETLAQGEPLPLVTAVKCPPGVKAEKIVCFLKEKHDIYISGGLGPHKEDTFRVGHMGAMATLEVAESFLEALGDFLKQHR
ncbi:Serine-pyruvate aminotransferase [Moorella thermoacetica]|uniref:Serine-pyruvate aminotransferase n=1 Tax=Neomoorella thermoacetica TaxID=1525 RepID=A0AAC9HJF9_NEOTH|nr:alanine--glyoxylate aminotransferase family protein [Moorella thermoacetica]AOQ25117.1 Soluble hydrogenase 42 kDa subunit [Moorella thermoacetica]TYL15352.1 Serine-pyruvate aminotransferase [Moorella thermoacetica]